MQHIADVDLAVKTGIEYILNMLCLPLFDSGLMLSGRLIWDPLRVTGLYLRIEESSACAQCLCKQGFEPVS